MLKSKYKINQIIFGWKIIRAEKLPENGIVFVELLHVATGAKYVHLDCTDTNNVFCVAFKTVPEDSSGVAHILEHTVLTGSQKYPVHDPFFSMIRRSMKTFMNAFTSNDWTAYPFATQNETDYFNLMSVYLDAAFEPLILEPSFEQEGWRLEMEGDELKYKGIVFNEMKGSMSSVDRIMSEAQKKALFKKSPYRFNSGGEPEDIVKLSHADLVSFHKKYYHPSNSYFFSYGSFSLDKTLQFLKSRVMDNCKKAVRNTELKPEKRLAKEMKWQENIPVNKGEDPKKKYQFALCWLMADLTDTKTVLALEILEDVLLSNEAAPLRRALIESGLGNDLADCSGFNTEFRDTLFSIGLKDVLKKDGPRIRKIIMETLEKLAKEGIPEELISAALQKLAIARKEVSNEPYPFGLKLWLDFVGAWIHGGDAFSILKIDDDLSVIKKEAKEKNLFPSLIKKHFLKNQHRVFLELVPKNDLFEKQAAKELAALDKLKNKMDTKSLARLNEKATIFKKQQEKTEDVSCLPILEKEDISAKERNRFRRSSGKQIAVYEMPLNGLCYANLYFDLVGLKEEFYPYVPFFCYVLNKIGTAKSSYLELVKKIDSYSGGIDFFPLCVSSLKKESPNFFKIGVQAKFLEENTEASLKIVKEILLEYAFLESDRLAFYLREQQLDMEMSLVESPQSFALSLAASGYSESALINELWSGKSQLLWLKKRGENLDEKNLEELKEKLQQIAAFVFVKERASGVVISGKNKTKIVSLNLQNIIRNLKSKQKASVSPKKHKVKKVFIGLGITSQVSSTVFVQAVSSVRSKDAAALFTLSKFLQSEFLHKEIREKGGAYGAYCRYDYLFGFLNFLSYRDPHVNSTIKTYLKVRDFAISFPFSQNNINEVVLQALSEIDKPVSPRTEAGRHYLWQKIGLEATWREKLKQEILSVKISDLRRVAKKYLSSDIQDYSVVVAASEEKLKGIPEIKIEQL